MSLNFVRPTCPSSRMCITSTHFLSKWAVRKRRWQYFGFFSMHIMHARLCLASSRSFSTPSLKTSVFIYASYPPRRYPPSSLPSQTYSILCWGNHLSISSFLKCSILDVGKLRMSTKTLILCSSRRVKNFSIDLLLCPIVHIAVCRFFKATTHLR